jgi:heme exporter protein D
MAKVTSVDHKGGSFKFIQPSTDSGAVFADLLLEMKYHYKAIAANQPPKFFTDGRAQTDDVKFMKIVADKQNAKFLLSVMKSQKALMREMTNSLSYGKVDICLNTNVKVNPNRWRGANPVNTYETAGYCAMIPIPPKPSHISFILDPYDFWTWGFLLFTLVCSIVTWKLFTLLPSGAHLQPTSRATQQLLRSIVGQSTEVIGTRWFHKMIILTFTMAMFVFGNVYQSLLTAMMTVDYQGRKLTTVNEVLSQDFNFVVESNFLDAFQDSFTLGPAKPDIRWTKDLDFFKIDYQEEAKNKTAIVIRCDSVNMLFADSRINFLHGRPSDFYYILKETLAMKYEYLLTSRNFPFHKKLNELSLRVFESGIRQHWKKMVKSFETPHDSETKDFLTMNELSYVFVIYGIGMLISLIVFLLEILVSKRLKIRKMIRTIMRHQRRKRLIATQQRIRRLRRARVAPLEVILEVE